MGYLLLDLMTFFDAYHGEKLDEALDIITKLKIVPLSQSEVEVVVSTFRVLVDEVRRNIPDVLLATMSILFTNYKQLKANSVKASTSPPAMPSASASSSSSSAVSGDGG